MEVYGEKTDTNCRKNALPTACRIREKTATDQNTRPKYKKRPQGKKQCMLCILCFPIDFQRTSGVKPSFSLASLTV